MENNKSVKRNRKLLVQIGLITLVMFLIAIALNLYIVYIGTVDVFLDAKSDMLAGELNYIVKSTDVGASRGWFYDYWQNHPEEVMSYNFDNYTPSDKGIDITSFDANERSYEKIEALSEDDKLLVAALYYKLSELSYSYEKDVSDYDGVFCIDVNGDNSGYIYFANTNDEAFKLGDRFEFDLDDHPAVKKLIESGSDKPEFEQTEDFPLSGSHYVGYYPVIIDGKLRCVIGVSYDWSDFNSGLQNKLIVMALIAVGGIGLIGAVMLILIYLKAIKPLGKVKDGVLEYMDTKDSGKVAERMSEIKTQNEVGLLARNFTELAKEIDRYTNENARLAGERERVEAELDMATKIQAEQLPNIFPAFPERSEFDIYATMTPAKEVGGDFYDFFMIDNDHLALVMADVSGKGVPAALFMMMSKILINNYAMMGLSPREVLERTNNTICKSNENKMFVTVWFGVLEISTGKITAANAGHEYPIIRQPNGSFELFKDKHSFVIGGIPGLKYSQYEYTLQKGATLFVYTDGVPEATDPELKLFGTDRLVETLNKTPDAPPEQLLENVHKAVNEFVGDAPQFDDLTMLGLTMLK